MIIYVAMFDEVDEGTAIFKCANDVPTGEQSKFVTFEGLPNDFYLKLVGKGAKLIRGDILLDANKYPAANLELNVKKIDVAGADAIQRR